MPDSGVPVELSGDATALARERTTLAFERTLLAHERTLMAWVRTATSLISFGFTIYKFFDYLSDARAGPALRRFGPRAFALAMIACGLFALVLAVFEHRRGRRLLARSGAEPQRSLAMFAGDVRRSCRGRARRARIPARVVPSMTDQGRSCRVISCCE
jgi:putative membrane protein